MNTPEPALPKVELHLHLDCSLSLTGLRRLGRTVTPDEYRREYVAPARCSNLAEFLACVPKVLTLLQTPEALTVMVEDVFEQLQQEHMLYAELRFAPLLHTAGGLSPERVVDTVDAAVEDMVRHTGIEARLILCTLRHFDEQQSLATARLVDAFRHRRVVALDLAGDEAGFPLAPHIPAYRFAHEKGLKTTAHAGEASGPASMWETLRELAPQRIGHGVRSIEDLELVEHLRRTGIHLEVCPSSNVQIMETIEAWPMHPVDRLHKAGVSLNINTDTRMLTPTTLAREYGLMREHFNWTLDDLLSSNLAALRHAFVDEALKETLRARLAHAWKAAEEAS